MPPIETPWGVSFCSENFKEDLMDMRTDLTAVPHAGLGYHVLRVQVRKPDPEARSIKFSVAINSKGTTERSTDRMTSSAHICKSKTKALCVTAESKPVQRLDFWF